MKRDGDNIQRNMVIVPVLEAHGGICLLYILGSWKYTEYESISQSLEGA